MTNMQRRLRVLEQMIAPAHKEKSLTIEVVYVDDQGKEDSSYTIQVAPARTPWKRRGRAAGFGRK
jgi:hypothetical protein